MLLYHSSVSDIWLGGKRLCRLTDNMGISLLTPQKFCYVYLYRLCGRIYIKIEYTEFASGLL